MSDNKQRKRTLELLAPAKNLECGIAAIDHGADAVYIGAPKFGARAAAGNSLSDIEELCQYAHKFGAKVHVTVNTIIYDDEYEDTLNMILKLDQIGVDAILLQDMGMLWEIRGQNLWHREIHSSTQCDCRTGDKAWWLSTVGFSRIVLARELSLEEIKAIHKMVPDRTLEVFVHGALCVSYSGVCYASQYCFGRSANRGECAQFCRMKFDLLDRDGRELEHQRHLLSLKDLCQIQHLEELADAGAGSFKIEGRLKDVNYVKNVVAAYSKALDEVVRRNPDKYRRASFGKVAYNFEPNLKKTFNRGFTTYFLNGRQPDIASFDTPKAMGEYVGKVKEIRGNISFNVATTASFANGDGLCFINDEHELEGFRVNRVEGNRLFPHHMPENLQPGMALYRNNDRAFENVLARRTAERTIPIYIQLDAIKAGEEYPFSLEQKVNIPVYEEDGIRAVAWMMTDKQSGRISKLADVFMPMELALSKRSQVENIKMQMSRLGDTIYQCQDVVLLHGLDVCFVPNSKLSALRRDLVEAMDEAIEYEVDKSLLIGRDRELFGGGGYCFSEPGEHEMDSDEFHWQPAYAQWGYLYNIANFSAYNFYQAHGLSPIKPAFELGKNEPKAWSATSEMDFVKKLEVDVEGRGKQPYTTNAKGESLLMQCRHCIRYSLGYCVKRGGKNPTWKEPLYLRLGDGRRFRLEFACNECQMNVYSEKE